MPTRVRIIILLLTALLLPSPASAFWIWTPESNQWVNPKYAVKETPKEQLDYAMTFFESQSYKEAVQELQKLLKNYPRSRQAPDAQYYIGRTYEDQGKLQEAFRQYQTVIDTYPFSERSPEIVQRQYDIGIRLLEGEEKQSLWGSLASPAIVVDIFEAVIKNAPYGKLAAPAQYKIGIYYMEQKLYQEARDAFEKVANDYPDSEWAKAAKYQIALSDAQRSEQVRYDQRITGTAVKEFEEFVEQYPEAEFKEEAQQKIVELRDQEAANAFQIALFYEKQQNYKAARIYYQTIIDEYTNSQWSSKALEKIRDLNAKNIQ